MRRADAAAVRLLPQGIVRRPRRHDRLRWEDHIRSRADTIYHPVGTCRWAWTTWPWWTRSFACGASRACASSTPRSCPTLIGGNTNAPTIMIAEKAADMILGKPPLAAVR